MIGDLGYTPGDFKTPKKGQNKAHWNATPNSAAGSDSDRSNANHTLGQQKAMTAADINRMEFMELLCNMTCEDVARHCLSHTQKYDSWEKSPATYEQWQEAACSCDIDGSDNYAEAVTRMGVNLGVVGNPLDANIVGAMKAFFK